MAETTGEAMGTVKKGSRQGSRGSEGMTDQIQ